MKTKQKIALAGIAYRGVSLLRGLAGRSDHAVVDRGGIRWDLDLREGIDFSIYLFGSFEPRTVAFYSPRIRAGDVVFDIGANVGAHTLPFARCVGQSGRVHAFEPTEFGFGKLRKNLELNPGLSARVVCEQLFLVAKEGDSAAKDLCASWPLVADSTLHPEHGGRSVSTGGAGAETLDGYVDRKSIARVDWVKIDVDGYEFSVLRGAESTLRKFRPKLILEFAPYLATEIGEGFEPLVELLRSHGYRASAIPSGREIPLDAARIREQVPPGSSINVLLEAKP